MEKNFVIHVGYPKTASTSLQEQLFEFHTDIHNIGKPDKGFYEDWGKIYDDNAPFSVKDLNIANVSLRASENKKCVMLSHEGISHYHKPELMLTRIKAIADYLAASPKFLVVLRRQEDTYLPLYVQREVVQNDPANLDKLKADFSDMLDTALKDPSSDRILSNLYYFTFYKRLRSFFPGAQICFLLYEELRDAPEDFVGKLCQFLNVDKSQAMELLVNDKSWVNRRSLRTGAYAVQGNPFYYRLKRLFDNTKLPLNKRKIVKTKFGKVAKYIFNRIGASIDIELNAEQKSALRAIYRHDNKLLCDELHLREMGKYDYCN